MKKCLFVIAVLCLACQEKDTESFYELYEQAQKESKYLWLNLNLSQDTAITETVYRYSYENKQSEQKYLFRQLNLLDTSNIFLFYILLVENTNYSYIFNPKGKIISYVNRPVTSESIQQQWDAIQQGQPESPIQVREFISRSDTLLNMLNLVLKTHLLFRNYPDQPDSLYTALNLIEEAISIEPYFYNLYLRCRIAEALGMDDAKEYARLAIQYCKEGYQKNVYGNILQELVAQYDIAFHTGKGIIEFQETTLNAGKIPLNSKHEFQFEFTNTGEEPVIIIYVSSSCGCATPIWDRTPILPDKTGKIKVVFNAEKYGNFIRSVFMQSSAQNNIEHLYLRGTVSIDIPPLQ